MSKTITLAAGDQFRLGVPPAVRLDASKCVFCGGSVTSQTCREVSRGWFCVRFFLIEDVSRWIAPAAVPDRRNSDRKVQEAQAAEDAALGDFRQKEAAHENVIREMARHGVQPPLAHTIVSAGQPPRPRARTLEEHTRIEARLRDEFTATKIAKDDATEALIRATTAVKKAYARAKR